jgi:hypothetical protein
MGILGFETYRQVFSPPVAAYLNPIQDKDLLGYVVVVRGDQPNAALVGFLAGTLPRQLALSRTIWIANGPFSRGSR